jgi:hypothetical protein
MTDASFMRRGTENTNDYQVDHSIYFYLINPDGAARAQQTCVWPTSLCMVQASLSPTWARN